MAYYHDLITEKSWEELQRLRKVTRFILIGGWAVYLYTKALKSKDIDIIVDFDALPRLEKDYLLNKNDRLKKYQARRGEVEIDIYLPHYSTLGIPVEQLGKQIQNVGGFTVVDSNYLFVLKCYTLSLRGRTPKGRKDLIDIVALMQNGLVDWEKVTGILKKYQLQESLKSFQEILGEYYEIPELNLNRHQFAKVKKQMQGRTL